MDSLTMVDRGDCCPAQARYLVGKEELRLMFCSHHFRKNEAALIASGWTILISDLEDLQQEASAAVG